MQRMQPALLGGLFIGVLSALPVINIVNICCCLWVVVGGILVTYLLQQRIPTPVETGEVVLQGLVAGVIGAIIACVGFVLLSGGIDNAALQESIRKAFDEGRGDVPQEVRDRVMNFVNARNIGLLMVVITLPVYAVFAMLGSLLGLAFFRKKSPPPTQG